MSLHIQDYSTRPRQCKFTCMKGRNRGYSCYIRVSRILFHKVYDRGIKGAWKVAKECAVKRYERSESKKRRKATYAVPLCRPMDTSRYICSSTRCPVSGTNLYVHLEGPWRYGDFICPKPRSDLLNSCLLSNVILHTETEQDDRVGVKIPRKAATANSVARILRELYREIFLSYSLFLDL